MLRIVELVTVAVPLVKPSQSISSVSVLELLQLPAFKPVNCEKLPVSPTVISVKVVSNTSATIVITPPEKLALNSPT